MLVRITTLFFQQKPRRISLALAIKSGRTDGDLPRVSNGAFCWSLCHRLDHTKKQFKKGFFLLDRILAFLFPRYPLLFNFYHYLSCNSTFKMSDFKATVEETKNGFHVDGYERISYDFTFLDGVFNPENPQLARCYEDRGRVLAVTDLNVYNLYGKQIEAYFQHHGLDLTFHKTKIGEKAKTIPTLLSIVDSMTEFGVYRKVPIINDSNHLVQSD
jgi:hypothetical protein